MRYLARCAEIGVGYVLVSGHVGVRVTDKEDYVLHDMVSKLESKLYDV